MFAEGEKTSRFVQLISLEECSFTTQLVTVSFISLSKFLRDSFYSYAEKQTSFIVITALHKIVGLAYRVAIFIAPESRSL